MKKPPMRTEPHKGFFRSDYLYCTIPINVVKSFKWDKFNDKWDGLVLNASDDSLELNVNANLDLFYQFESNYLFDPEPSHSVILMQSVPGHFYDRLGKDWIPEFYNPIAK